MFDGFNPCFSGTTTQTSSLQVIRFPGRSFNPCFSGTTTQTQLIWFYDAALGQFQSLFFWNHYLDMMAVLSPFLAFSVSILVFLEPLLRPTQREPLKYHCLVSILVFLEPLLRPLFQQGTSGKFSCFNPCFSGTTTQTFLPTEGELGIWVFQSLFFWNHYLDMVNHCGIAWSRRSFNPCFSGTTTQTICHEKIKKILDNRFQSLFFWNHYLDYAGHFS